MQSMSKLKTKRKSSQIPFGYKLNDNGIDLEPVEKEIEALKTILPMIRSSTLSLREGALWITHKTGRSLSHEGLRLISEAND